MENKGIRHALSSREFDFFSEQHNPYRYFPVDDEGYYPPPMDEPTLDRCAQSLRIMQLVASGSMLGSSALLLITILPTVSDPPKGQVDLGFLLDIGRGIGGIASFLVVRSLKPKQWKETSALLIPLTLLWKNDCEISRPNWKSASPSCSFHPRCLFQYFRTGNLLCLSTCLILIGVMAISFPRWSWLEAKMERRSWKIPLNESLALVELPASCAQSKPKKGWWESVTSIGDDGRFAHPRHKLDWTISLDGRFGFSPDASFAFGRLDWFAHLAKDAKLAFGTAALLLTLTYTPSCIGLLWPNSNGHTHIPSRRSTAAPICLVQCVDFQPKQGGLNTIPSRFQCRHRAVMEVNREWRKALEA